MYLIKMNGEPKGESLLNKGLELKTALNTEMIL